jgi:hypothetical protein
MVNYSLLTCRINIGDLHVLWESSPHRFVAIKIHQVILSSKGLALAVDDLLGPLDVFTVLNDSQLRSDAKRSLPFTYMEDIGALWPMGITYRFPIMYRWFSQLGTSMASLGILLLLI